ncbi:MAG: hypothetical protein CVU65_03315 [Deltaproteobacteria bacterium HGW-Deltaproteobacteria-22]|nr:MAG: hypothetical protein CVU65_03315 [Deltaproteobacteria bacterium HGW-Deltaproteobacteria-22]
MPHPDPTSDLPSPDLQSTGSMLSQLTRQTGLLPMLGAGCALTLVAFVIPVVAAWWLAGWSWWLVAGAAAGVICAAATAFLGARIVARRMLTRLAGLSDQNGDGDGAEPRASTDPYELATELILSVFRGEKDTGDLFTRINREEPAVGAEVAAIVRARAIDDLVNGMDPDEVRVQRLADLVRATGAGVRKLANPGTAGPWKELTAELEEVLKELVTSLDPEANERARNQVPDDDPT